MNDQEYVLWVGIDWADRAHQVTALRGGQVVGEREVAHSADGLEKLVGWLIQLCDGQAEQVAVAIELTRGSIVDTLLERGFHVYTLNPKQLDRFRDRHSVAGAKDDRLDAYVLADSLRTDLKLYRRLEPDAREVVELRELSRIDSELGDEVVRVRNRLREQLWRYFPQMLELSPNADAPWLPQLLKLVPTPEDAKKIRPRDLERQLPRMRKYSAREVLKTLRKKPLHLAPGAKEAATAHVGFLLPQLELLRQQRRESLKRIEGLLKVLQEPVEGITEHRDAKVLLSASGIASRIGATMLSEGTRLLEHRDYHRLRALAGSAPVTRQTGKWKRTVVMRQACNSRLRDAVFNWARVSMQKDPRSKAHYQRLRAKGHGHARALRGLSDRLLKMLVAMLKSGTLYDPSKRTVAQEPSRTAEGIQAA